MVVTRLNRGCRMWNSFLGSDVLLQTKWILQWWHFSVVVLAGVSLTSSWGNAGPLPLRKLSPHTCPMLMWTHLFSVTVCCWKQQPVQQAQQLSVKFTIPPPRGRGEKSHVPIRILYEYESVWTCSSEWQIGESCKLTSSLFFKTCPKTMYWKENGAVRDPRT